MVKKIQLTKDGEDAYPITVPDAVAGLANVAKTGSYNDLTDKPTTLQYYLCQDKAEYEAIQNKDSGTLYLIPIS